jgi:hypothetical protein
MTYAQVRERLEQIEDDLAGRQMHYGAAASDYYRAKRDYEAAYAREYVKAEGKNTDERKARALLALMPSDAYKALVIAEAQYEGAKAVQRTLETRASIGQSLLRALQAEVGG